MRYRKAVQYVLTSGRCGRAVWRAAMQARSAAPRHTHVRSSVERDRTGGLPIPGDDDRAREILICSVGTGRGLSAFESRCV